MRHHSYFRFSESVYFGFYKFSKRRSVEDQGKATTYSIFVENYKNISNILIVL